MTAFKAKVKVVHPKAYCAKRKHMWKVCVPPLWDQWTRVLGQGRTAFSAWVDAWRNIEKGDVTA